MGYNIFKKFFLTQILYFDLSKKIFLQSFDNHFRASKILNGQS